MGSPALSAVEAGPRRSATGLDLLTVQNTQQVHKELVSVVLSISAKSRQSGDLGKAQHKLWHACPVRKQSFARTPKQTSDTAWPDVASSCVVIEPQGNSRQAQKHLQHRVSETRPLLEIREACYSRDARNLVALT